jgi:cytoskeleton protein RodZ
MKSIGEHLKTAREEKGFSFDQVVHDTNISREYIHALEEDNFDFFPAEAYLIGFLRNYSEYLGLDPSKMVGIYKNYKISEEPVPMDLLLGKKKSAPEKKEQKDEFDVSRKSFPRWIIPVIAMILIIGGVAVVFLPSLLNRGTKVGSETEVVEQEEEVPTGPKEFFLTEETLDITVFGGDKINVSTGSNLISFSVNITESEKSLIYQDVENILKKMDLKKDIEQVILIEGDKGVYFYIKEVNTDNVTLIAQKVTVDETAEKSVTNAAFESNADISAERIAEKKVIISETYPGAYEVDAFFRGDGLFRYRTDDQPGVERFYQAGERLKIDVNRSVFLWISNAGIVDLKISGKEINAGGNGQVVVRSVKWIKNNETGKYELVILPYN